MFESDFNINPEITYLDCAGRSPLPLDVEKVGHLSVTSKVQPWKELPDCFEEITELYSQLINAESPHCISLAPSTSFAITLATENILKSGILGLGKYIIIMFGEMESSVMPWQSICQQTGSTLLVVTSTNQNKTWADEFLDILQTINPGSLAVVSLSCVHWCSGEYVDVLRISQYVKENYLENLKLNPQIQRPYIIIDGTQSIGVEPFNVQLIQPDFVACSVHKWLLSPYGCSIMYLHPRHHNTWESLDKHDRNRLGNNQSEWVEITGMRSTTIPLYSTAYQWGAKRITSSGRINPILSPMISAALNLIINKYGGPISIQSYISELINTLIFCIINDTTDQEFIMNTNTNLTSIVDNFILNHGNSNLNDNYIYSPIGIQILPSNRRSKHIIGLKIHSDLTLSPSEINQQLSNNGIKISVRQSYLRISPYLYNTKLQMIQLYSKLREIIVKGGRKSLENNLILPYSNRPKVLIIGGSGWLGQHLIKNILHQSNLSQDLEVHLTYCSYRPSFLLPHQIYFLDLCQDETKIDEIIINLKPIIIIHLAAQSSPLKCNQSPEIALALNNPSYLIESIKKYLPNTLFIYTSTDLVYDGNFPPYTPLISSSFSTIPTTTYGKTKFAFENEVISLKHGLILRLSNMVGGGYVFESPTSSSPKFLEWLQKNYLLKNFISLKNDEIRSFVYVQDVCMLIIKIIKGFINQDLDSSHPCWLQKVYNVGGKKGFSRLEFARILSETQGCKLQIQNNEENLSSSPSPSSSLEYENKWIVNSVSSESFINKTLNIDQPPKDVTLDISLTELHFNIEFHDLTTELSNILKQL